MSSVLSRRIADSGTRARRREIPTPTAPSLSGLDGVVFSLAKVYTRLWGHRSDVVQRTSLPSRILTDRNLTPTKVWVIQHIRRVTGDFPSCMCLQISLSRAHHGRFSTTPNQTLTHGLER